MSDYHREKFNLRTRLRSFAFAFSGIAYLLRTQHNTRIHLLATCMVVVLGFLLRVSPTEWCLLAFAIGFVIVSEALNTAVETLTDLISPNHHHLARVAKDVGAGAVLVAACISATVGMIVFGPKIWEWFSGQIPVT